MKIEREDVVAELDLILDACEHGERFDHLVDEFLEMVDGTNVYDLRYKNRRVNVLDKGYVILRNYYVDDDLNVVNAGRASYQKRTTEMRLADHGLLAFLGTNGHTSPFRHAFATFEISAPLEVARQWWKYVVGSDHTMDGWNEACLPGDQELRGANSQKWTVAQLFEKYETGRTMPFLRSVGPFGEITLNRVKRVWKSGVQAVYEVTSDLGLTVRTTGNHRYMTPNGWAPLDNLLPGSLVMMNGIPAWRDKEWLREHYVVQGLSQKECGRLAGCSDHNIRKWVSVFGLQQDQVARMQKHNEIHGVFGKGLTADDNEAIRRRTDLMSVVRTGVPAYASGEAHHAYKGDEAADRSSYHVRARKIARELFAEWVCAFCDEVGDIAVHHIDADYTNNTASNLILVCDSHHKMMHGKQVTFVPHPVALKSIRYVGEMETFDIEMEGAPNFVASGFVVHNSRRYVTLEPEFTTPSPGEWRGAPDNKKQGSKGFLPKDAGRVLTEQLAEHQQRGKELYEQAMAVGVAPEQARLFLAAYGMYTTWVWSGSVQSIAHFLNQRLDEHAQAEIREYARAVYELIVPCFPSAIKSLLTANLESQL